MGVHHLSTYIGVTGPPGTEEVETLPYCHGQDVPSTHTSRTSTGSIYDRRKEQERDMTKESASHRWCYFTHTGFIYVTEHTDESWTCPRTEPRTTVHASRSSKGNRRGSLGLVSGLGFVCDVPTRRGRVRPVVPKTRLFGGPRQLYSTHGPITDVVESPGLYTAERTSDAGRRFAS